MYIELFGYPGSGKTTIVSEISKKQREIQIERNITILKSKIGACRDILFLIKLGWFCINAKYISKKLISGLLAKQYFQKKYRSQLYITDHGFLQVLLSEKRLMKKIVEMPNILEMYKKLLPEGIYVLVNTKKEKSIAQEKKREKRLYKDQKEKKEHYELCQKIIKEIQKKIAIESIISSKELQEVLYDQSFIHR